LAINISNDPTRKNRNCIKFNSPSLQRDGGDVELVSIENNLVKVKMVRASETCSRQASILKTGIEELIMNAIPEAESVIAI
jgi:Fe-S cluster biogenesis protein NfuA